MNTHTQITLADVDLAPIKRKLMSDDGPHWTEEECDLAATEYQKFLTLLLLHPNEDLVPNHVMDEVWHFHILDTRKYHEDTKRLFGHYLHHYPYFGMDGPAAQTTLARTFAKTKTLYRQAFGGEMRSPIKGLSDAGASCGRNCASSCRNE